MMQKKLWLILGMMVFCGCGQKDVPRADVEGSVTFEKKPISEGVILFIPIPGVQGAPVQLDIKDGHYSSKADKNDRRGVVIGQNDVQIMMVAGTGKKVRSPDGDLIDETVQSIPVRFNEQTELRRDIKRGVNELNFDLE